jgi:3,4-dihydroxy 2-butanone 4-phosphate synthase/GTP cyclohydrolase II
MGELSENIPVLDIKKLIYKTECLLPTINGDFQLHLFTEQLESGETKEHLALVMGDVRDQVGVLLRIHSECCTGDIFGCQRCDCQDQLNTALDMIRRRRKGVLLYLRQEGRGIGLENKLKAYQLQDVGLDTVDANLALGFEADYRKYDIAAEMIKRLGIKSVELISNNTNKLNEMRENGVKVSKRVPIVINSPTRDRMNLFRTKQKKLGHVFDALDSTYIIEEEEEYPLSSPSLFIENAPIPKVSRENTKLVTEKLTSKFGDNLTCILLQGSNMRGDGSIHDSDFDYICIFKELSPSIITDFSEIKNELPRNNFLYLSEEEYSMYPKDARLQFFITRRAHGEFDLGRPPSRKDILDTAIKYAIQLKDVIRPLLFEFMNNPKDKSLLSQAHTALKRVDDCFMRVVCLYITGKYPLHREHLKNIAQGESVNEIAKIIDSWYSGNISAREVCEALRTADRLINIFLRMSKRNKI